MSYPPSPQREHPSTYIVQDRGNLDEIKRLAIQDKMLTTEMGGPLPELADPNALRRVLDVGCGTGGWLIETAKAYPTIEQLVGADISGKMLVYARAQAEAQRLDERVQFKIMDALCMLEFQTSSFDLVNQRLGSSWLRTWDWIKILLEYLRVTRPGGIIRITEGHVHTECNSPALTKLNSIALDAFYHSGRLWTLSNDGMTCELVRLLTQYGIEDVETRVHTLVYQAGVISGQYFYDDIALIFRLFLPFFQKWTRVPDDYQQIYQQALKEMQAADFVATWTALTVWGIRPRDGRPVFMRGLK